MIYSMADHLVEDLPAQTGKTDADADDLARAGADRETMVVAALIGIRLTFPNVDRGTTHKTR